MIKLDFKLNGRSVGPNQLGRELEKVVLKEFQESVKQQVSRIRCRTHGGHARVTFQGSSPQNMNFNVSGCCDDLVEEVRRKVK